MEELGLWGYNTLLVWLDMSHFKSFDDPEAVTFRRRLHAICEAAAGIGLDVGFMVIANEGYNTSPAELRALNKNGAQRGGWYDCQVCPSKPEGMKYIIGAFRQLLDWWSDLHPAYVCICAYDQGGCGCDLCRPWGTNGFPRTAKKLVALARRQLPEVKVIVSTWQFDVEEWRSLSREFSEKAPWADYVLAEGIVQPMSRGLPIVGFPEISMYNMRPWGGFVLLRCPTTSNHNGMPSRTAFAADFPIPKAYSRTSTRYCSASSIGTTAPPERPCENTYVGSIRPTWWTKFSRQLRFLSRTTTNGGGLESWREIRWIGFRYCGNSSPRQTRMPRKPTQSSDRLTRNCPRGLGSRGVGGSYTCGRCWMPN